MSGTPVFAGSRVPVKSLFDHLEGGYSLEEFLDQFPSVKKNDALAVLEQASKFLSSEKFLNENLIRRKH